MAATISQRALASDKGSFTDGYSYAENLYQDFTTHGVEAYLIQFHWDAATIPYVGACVVFRDADGRYWAQQSTSLHPRWVSGTNPAQWVQSLYGQYPTAVASVADNRSVVGYHNGHGSYAQQ